MRLKIKIAGPKVHDVGYRCFLMSMAMSNMIRMFEAHNTESDEGQEVLIFADGEDKAIEAFRSLVKTKQPARSKVSNIAFDDFDGEIMRIGEYAQFCSTVQLNKAIPVLLDIRDDIKEMKGDVKEMKGDIKSVRKTTEATLEETKSIRKTTDITLEEIRGMREDIQPGYGMTLRQVQSDIRAIKERLGMQ
ncbi:MAG: Acylphosphatase [Methanosaeta sp. PtaU1.Bin112]|nr:MAG: Acylphosphatase [Methanosaeta sp. PtaU1.Bin112]